MESNEEPPDFGARLKHISAILNEVFRTSQQRECLDRIILGAYKNPGILNEYSKAFVRNETDFNNLYVIIMKHLGQRICKRFESSRAPEKIASDLAYPIIRKVYSEIYL